MRLVVAGGAGYVGSELIPLLADSFDEVVVVGREVEKLRRMFPNLTCVSYTDISEVIRGFDMMLCLITLNNDRVGRLEEFREVNVGKVMEIANIARDASIKKFVHFSTFHLVSVNKLESHYSITKYEGERELVKMEGIEVINLRLPAVYGNKYKGKLKFISLIPKTLRRYALRWISALQPVVSVENLAGSIESLKHMNKETMYVSDLNSCSKYYCGIKRGIDLTGAITVIVVLGWLFPVLWLIVKFDSNGPGVIAQERVGKDMKPFNCYKLRTMFEGTEVRATHHVSENAVTASGKWLRKTKLDELPQVINVLKNDMSLVGPRPCLPQQLDLVACRKRDGVFDAKPGITGFAQIKGVDMSHPEILSDIDRSYVQTRSILLDLKIIVATIMGRGLGDHVTTKKKIECPNEHVNEYTEWN